MALRISAGNVVRNEGASGSVGCDVDCVISMMGGFLDRSLGPPRIGIGSLMTNFGGAMMKLRATARSVERRSLRAQQRTYQCAGGCWLGHQPAVEGDVVVVRERRDEIGAGQASAIGSKGEREGANALHIWCPRMTISSLPGKRAN